MPQNVPIADFADIEAELVERTRASVWCNVATVDSRGRPRSRVLHPLWEGGTGWILTRRRTPKADDLGRNPYVSLAYLTDVWKPTYVDCRAEWVDDAETRRRVWQLFLTTPPPVGYDPGPVFNSHADPSCGVLKLTPWRVTLGDSAAVHRVWRRP